MVLYDLVNWNENDAVGAQTDLEENNKVTLHRRRRQTLRVESDKRPNRRREHTQHVVAEPTIEKAIFFTKYENNLMINHYQ